MGLTRSKNGPNSSTVVTDNVLLKKRFVIRKKKSVLGKTAFSKKTILGNRFSVHRNAKPLFRRIDYTRFRDRLFSDSETGFLTAKPVSGKGNRFRYERTGFPPQKPVLPRENRFSKQKTGFAPGKPVFKAKYRFLRFLQPVSRANNRRFR